MKIDVPNIPPEGQTFDFNQDTPWFSQLLESDFRDLMLPKRAAQGKINLYKTHQNVSCNGGVHAELSPTCSRCAAPFLMSLDVPIKRHLVPQFSLGPREPNSDEEGIELSEEDLDFGTYQNEEIDLGEIVAEEIRLALPMRFLCSEACRGLCLKCGANLNEGNCSCPPGSEASPFAALKNLQVKLK